MKLKSSFESASNLERYLLTYDTVYAPPATVFLQDLQSQIPTECLLTVGFPQKVQVYLACCVISIFFTCFRSDAPYLFHYGQTEVDTLNSEKIRM